MAEIAVAVASEVAKCLVAPVGRHCGYVIFCDRRIRELNAEIEKLVGTKDDVQSSIDEARNDMKPILPRVEEWVKDAEASATNARDMLENDGRAKKTCFYGWLPNPKARYRLGNEASKMIKEIKELIEQGQFKRVHGKISPPGRVDSTPDVNSSAGDGGNAIFKSQASTFQDVMNALYDEKHKVIGVYGPGGVGKTTLLEIVEDELKKKGKPFRMIVKSKVSQNSDVTKIQDNIAYGLGLNNLKNEPSEEGRRDLLFKRLQMDPSEKVLIILDDLWAELDLKAVGIPLGNESMKCKLLLASRDKRVLEQRMHADQTFRLKSLEEDEAFKLFEKIVGDRLRDDEELKEKAAQVVTKLAGLPLLINSVASTLKCSDVSTWEDMLIKIEDPNNERIVKWSYDHLESEEAKCLFLLCGLIGGTIEVELLLGLGMGLGLFGGFDNKMQSLRNRLNTMLNSLHSFCLLQDGGNGKENVTIHDLYSEVVVSNAFSGQNSLMINNNYGSWPKEKLEKCWACLVNVGSDRLAELMPHQFPHVKILMLSEQYDMGDCSRMDFTYLRELRVLYLGSMHITSLPSSMEILGNLRSLSISCHVEDVANLGKLKALQILSFVGSEISKLPKELGKLTNLRSLNLSNCYLLEIIEPGALKGLINLEELYMNESFDQWMGEDEIPLESCNARLAELKSLTKLTTLEILIPDPTVLFKDGDLPFGNLIKFWINIGNVVGREFEGLRTMKLKFEGCDNILSKEWVQKTLQRTQYLHLDGLGAFKKNAHELCIQGFTQLKHLDIHNSLSIKYIASSPNDLLTAFTILESLLLRNLINLEKICNGPVALDCFSKLKVVDIAECHRLKNMWFLLEMQRLEHLEKIRVCECDSLQAIITDDAGKVEVAVDDMVELPNVRSLELCDLPNMISFCIRAEGAPIQVSLPHLESLVMIGLLGLEKILYSEPSLKYSKLKSIEIKESISTSKSILKLDWIQKMPNLESMKIDGSPSAEVVFDLEELKVIGDVEILSQLTELMLSNLLNLQRMWKRDVQLQGVSIFQNLEELYVNSMGLSFLFPLSVAKCLREIREIIVEDCPNMKMMIMDEEGRDEGTDDILEFPLLNHLRIWRCPMEKFFSYPHGKKESVTTISYSQDAHSDSFFDQKVSLPSLETLKLQDVGSFKRIWHGEFPRSSFCKLATLSLEYCSDLLNVFPSIIIGRLLNLKSVEIGNCPSLESLFDCGSLDANTEQTTILLPKLEVVRVSNVGKLRYMASSNSQMILDFPSLKGVSFYNCSDLRYLFPNFTATMLEKLDRIRQCEQMKEVVPEEESGRSKVDVMSFSCLRYLIISQCPNFKAFIRSPTSVERQLGETVEKNDESPQPLFNEMVTFPNVRELEFEGLQCKELWPNHIPANSFCKLESLTLEDCNNLQCIASSHMWKMLQCCLENLFVISCHSIETIYEGNGMDPEGGKLRWLILRDLKNLRRIWQSNSLPNIPFPNLRDVETVRCPHLEMLFPIFTAKFLGQIEELVVESCEDMELISGHEKGDEVTRMTITFSRLFVLRLFKLPKFKSFFLPEKYSLKFPCSEVFPCLEVLSIVSCGAEPDQVLGSWEGYREASRRREFRRKFHKLLSR